MTTKSDAQKLFDRMARSYRTADAKSCAALFTQDAVLLSPYAPATHGRAAIEALHRDWMADGPSEKTLTVLDAGGAGDQAWCFVAYSEGDPAFDGKTLCTLKRQPDGGWLVQYCSLTSDIPPLA
ncbi:MAG: nuclear transport factor 2 family protein [Albidovulum sp.]